MLLKYQKESSDPALLVEGGGGGEAAGKIIESLDLSRPRRPVKKCTQWRGLKMHCSEKDRTWGITLPEYNVWMSLPGANSADTDVFELKS